MRVNGSVLENNYKRSNKMLHVIKRDQRIKEFDFERIKTAVVRAYADVYEKSNVKDDEIENVLSELKGFFNEFNDGLLEVETIQDVIVHTIESFNPFVAGVYNEYRALRSMIRDNKSELVKSINGLLDNTNIDVLHENSNKQSQLASTQRDLIAGEVSKFIARRLIPKHIMDAHDKGLIKIHDLDYYIQGIYNCELVNLEDMLQNGTVINKKLIEKPKSLRTAVTIATQIAAQVASSTYGGQTMSLSHLAPFVRISRERIRDKYVNLSKSGCMAFFGTKGLDDAVDAELRAEIKDAVQTFNYQISTIMCTNGQAPFISVCMYISENPEYEEETVMLIEEFLKQRIAGIKNEFGVAATQTFPKLLYFLDENNTYAGSKYYWLTELACKSTTLRMNPDYISVKKMKEVIGFAFPTMGCRAMLSPFKNADGEYIFYGRGNLGAQTINLPYVALESGGDIDDFWAGLDKALEITRQMCALRYEKLRGVKADSAPIIWQHGAISRLNPNDDVLKAVDERGFTVSIGYAGIFEAVKYLTGESHTSGKGFELAEKIMKYLRDKCLEFKEEQPHLRFALYGTPQESTTGWFSNKIKRQFGVVDGITDKGWITNSYHVDIQEPIDAFEKLNVEAKLQKYSTGGAVSYVETYNMSKNQDAAMQLIQHMYETIIYAEMNFESDVCGECKYEGVMGNDPDTMEWVCPNCGNRNQKTLSVVRRTCGYLGENVWTEGRLKDILNRVKHL